MASKSTHDTIKHASRDLSAPQLQEIGGGIAGVRDAMEGLRGQIDAMRATMRQFEKFTRGGIAAVRCLPSATSRIDDVAEIRQRLDATAAGKS